MDHYAVIGNPIDHSLSPIIHHLFATQTHQHINYQKILVPVDKLAETLDQLQNKHYRGLSITTPFKEAAFKLVTRLTERARKASCINTIAFQSNGERLGDNTDGVGLMNDLLRHHRITINGRSIIIFAAGGATRNILFSLLAENPSRIVIANRTVEKALALCQEVNLPKVTACDFEHLPTEGFDLIINATSAGLHHSLLPLTLSLVHSHTIFYDLTYGHEAKAIQQQAKLLGIKQCYDGLGMLVEQGAEQFLLWRNIKPETQSVIEALRKKLK